MRDYQIKVINADGEFVRWQPVAAFQTAHLEGLLQCQYGKGANTAAYNDTTEEAIFERIRIELLARSLGLATQQPT